MRYQREFFAVQLAFAQKMASLTRQPYPEIVLHNTALYRILGLGWDFDANNPVWQEYCAGLRYEETDVDWTHLFYLTHLDDIPEYDTSRPHWGCFSYEYAADTHSIRMHFAGSLDTSGHGPLTSSRREARMAELGAMFTSIREQHPEARVVCGGSWLYSRQEYTRLFPAEYGRSARVDTPYLRTRGLWGQFLHYTGCINERVATLFRERLGLLANPAEYAQCFPYPSMRTEAPVRLFYDFYFQK